MMQLPLFNLLRDKRYLAVACSVGAAMFSFEYYLMAMLPGAKEFQCVIGGFLTPLNIAFSLSSSLLMGFMVSGIVSVVSKRRGSAAAATSLGSISAAVGILTTFCTLCTLPVLTLFGLSLGLEIFTTYNLVFKFTSMALLLIGLYLLNMQMNRQCYVCIVPYAAKTAQKFRFHFVSSPK
jgi:hypothetical protein